MITSLRQDQQNVQNPNRSLTLLQLSWQQFVWDERNGACASLGQQIWETGLGGGAAGGRSFYSSTRAREMPSCSAQNHTVSLSIGSCSDRLILEIGYRLLFFTYETIYIYSSKVSFLYLF